MDFGEQTLKATQQLLLDGYSPPFHMVQIGANGVMEYYRFTVSQDKGLVCDHEMLAEYPEGTAAESTLPINQLWVDARGATNHVTITDRGAAFRFSPN